MLQGDGIYTHGLYLKDYSCHYVSSFAILRKPNILFYGYEMYCNHIRFYRMLHMRHYTYLGNVPLINNFSNRFTGHWAATANYSYLHQGRSDTIKESVYRPHSVALYKQKTLNILSLPTGIIIAYNIMGPLFNTCTNPLLNVWSYSPVNELQCCCAYSPVTKYSYHNFTCESLMLSWTRLYPGSTSGSLLMSSSAISAAGKPPDELKPNWPNDVINMNVRLVLFGSRASHWQYTDSASNTNTSR